MNVIGIGQSDLGKRRETNEDGLLADNDLGLYVVCDGMGGHAAGEVASTTAIETTASVVRDERALIEQIGAGTGALSDLVELARRAVQRACQEVHRLATSRPQYHGMGCTLTMLLAAGRKAVMAHVGDTRLYLVRAGAAHLLSADHTMAADLARMGTIEAEDVKTHPYAHVLTRAIGTQASVQVDTLLLDLLPGDRLLLCSDGLTEHLDEPGWLAARVSAPELESIPDELIASANEAGGRDNITALVVNVEAEPAEQTDALRADVELKLGTLASVFLFGQLSLSQLARVLNTCRLQAVAARETVVAEGDSCAALYVVLEGALSLVSDAGPSDRLGPGEHVGEATLANPRRARASVVAATPTKLLVLDRDALLRLIRSRPWLGVSLLERLAWRLSRDLDGPRAEVAL